MTDSFLPGSIVVHEIHGPARVIGPTADPDFVWVSLDRPSYAGSRLTVGTVALTLLEPPAPPTELELIASQLLF